MLSRFSSHIRKKPITISVERRNTETLSTSSLEAILPPSVIKYVTATKSFVSPTKIVKEQKTLSTGSLESISAPSENKYITATKSAPSETTFISNKNIIDAFHQEILQYSAKYIKRNIDLYDAEQKTMTLVNTLLDYGTEIPTAENFEIIINGIHSPGVYTIKQNGYNVVITFNETLFSFDGLQTENVIVIGKLLDVALLTEEDTIITDETGQALIL